MFSFIKKLMGLPTKEEVEKAKVVNDPPVLNNKSGDPVDVPSVKVQEPVVQVVEQKAEVKVEGPVVQVVEQKAEVKVQEPVVQVVEQKAEVKVEEPVVQVVEQLVEEKPAKKPRVSKPKAKKEAETLTVSAPAPKKPRASKKKS
jgi:hypothetical protein